MILSEGLRKHFIFCDPIHSYNLPVDSSQHLCQLLLHQWPLISSDTCQQLEIQTEGTGEGPKKMMATGKKDFNCIDNLENPSI